MSEKTGGTLYLVSTPIGNLADLTHRAEEVLRSSDAILAEDTRRTRILLEHYGIVGRSLRSLHKHNEAARTAQARAALAAGETLALVSDSGTPLISDPGFRLVRAAIEAGAAVIPIPGPSAALAALVASGLDPEPFTFFGFAPRSGRRRREFMAQLAVINHTAVFFESPHRLVGTLEDVARVVGGERGAVVARELTKIHEEFVRGTLSDAIAYYKKTAPRGEVVICLEAAPTEKAAASEEAAREVARSMMGEGATSKEIVQALRDRYDLDRNRAYALALEVAQERGS